MYNEVPVTLTRSQFNKIRAGYPIQLANHQIAPGMHRHSLMLHPENAKKVAGAIRRRKGVRIHVSPHEFEASGEGIMDFFNKLKDAGKWIKDKVIDTPFYQSSIKPLVRQVVDTGFSAVAPKLGIAAPTAKQAVDALGRTTGAYGVRRVRGGYMPVAPRISKNYSPLLSAQHPAMWPSMPELPDIGGKVPVRYTAPARKKKPAIGRGRPRGGRRPGSGSFRSA